MIKPKVAIIILNWNNFKDTIECLESIYQITYSNYDVILVDNNSEDQSIKQIKKYCEGEINIESKFFEFDPKNKPIKIIEYTREEAENILSKENEITRIPSNKKLILIKNEKNYGFAEGNNIGMRYSLKTLNPNYVFVLNNDTVVDKEVLIHLVKFMEHNRDVGICNSLQYSYYNKDIILAAGVNLSKFWLGNFNAEGLKHPVFREPFETTYAMGACIFIGKSLLSELCGFDEKMFIGAEDIDISLRCWIGGKKVMVVPNSVIYHKHNVSVKKKPIDWLVYYGVRSLIRCMLKNLQAKTLIITLPSFLLVQIRSLILDIIVRRDIKIVIARINAVLWILLNIREIAFTRKCIQRERVFSDTRFLNLNDWENKLQSKD